MGVGGGSSGGGAVSYKEPPQSKLKKLWATDPLEQNSKTGKEKPLVKFITVQNCLCSDCPYRRVDHVLLGYKRPKVCPVKSKGRNWADTDV